MPKMTSVKIKMVGGSSPFEYRKGKLSHGPFDRTTPLELELEIHERIIIGRGTEYDRKGHLIVLDNPAVAPEQLDITVGSDGKIWMSDLSDEYAEEEQQVQKSNVDGVPFTSSDPVQFDKGEHSLEFSCTSPGGAIEPFELRLTIS